MKVEQAFELSLMHQQKDLHLVVQFRLNKEPIIEYLQFKYCYVEMDDY